MTMQVDCKALAFSGRPDCIDPAACRVYLTLAPRVAWHLACDIVEKLGLEALLDLQVAVERAIRREDW